MAVSLLARLARRGRVPVFVLVGDGGRARARGLLLDPRIERVASPRQASVLLLIGELSPTQVEAARHVHDQLPPPFDVVAWSTRAEALAFGANVSIVSPRHDAVPVIVELYRLLMERRRPSARLFGPSRNPLEWRGVGPHGQGGEGMMGGHPYGRSMAMTGDDGRDGLQLDRLSVSLGPFLPWMPPGLSLEVVLQGDLVQEVEVHVTGGLCGDTPEIFVRARHEEVEVAALERARARHLLEATSDLLVLHGLDALAVKALCLARDIRSTPASVVRRLHRRLRRTGALRLATHGVGPLRADQVVGLGPVARASGGPADARAEDPAYAELGFSPILGERGDANARWQQRLAEAAQALDLAARAGARRRHPKSPLELPRGACDLDTSAWPGRLAELGPGTPLDAFVTTLVSLDLDAPSSARARPGAETVPCPP